MMSAVQTPIASAVMALNLDAPARTAEERQRDTFNEPEALYAFRGIPDRAPGTLADVRRAAELGMLADASDDHTKPEWEKHDALDQSCFQFVK